MIRLDSVTYSYPFQDSAAVSDLSLGVNSGEIVLVTGASGCGKSTLIRLINGLCPHFFKGELSGKIEIDNRETAERSIHEIGEDVGTVFQDPELQFFALRVEDELAFAHECRGESHSEIAEAVTTGAAAMGIADLLGATIHDLSEGQKQKLAIASILSLSPKVLVFDEPTANLDPESTLELAEKFDELKKMGLAILVVDHRLYWLEGVVDRVVVMEEGRIVEEGPFAILKDDQFCTRYGLRQSHVSDQRQLLPAPPADAELVVDGLSFTYKKSAWRSDSHEKTVFEDVSFTLGKGITAIIGDNGQGKTTLARLLTGLLKMQRGTLRLAGRELPAKELLAKASIVLQNTDHQLHMNTVFKELATAAGHAKTAATDRNNLQTILEEFNLAHLADRHPQSLSGGEKQRLVIACGVVREPEILILDEPTSGLDGRNMKRIAAVIARAAERGAIVLLITHDLELLAGVADQALHLPIKKTRG